MDRFDAAGDPNRLSEMLETTPGIDRSRVKFVFWDLKAEFNIITTKDQLNLLYSPTLSETVEDLRLIHERI